MATAKKYFFKCTSCKGKTSSTIAARADLKLCVKCQPELDAAPAKTKAAKATAAAPAPRARNGSGTMPAPAVVVKSAACEAKSPAPATTKKMSALDAAAMLLRDTGATMTPREIYDAVSARGLWDSPKGDTPWATIAAAIGREIAAGAADCRFVKPERGKFAASPATA